MWEKSWLTFKNLTNAKKSDVNLSTLALPCSRILFVCDVEITAYIAVVGSWLPTPPLPTSREKISQPESSCQPFHSKMGTSPLSPGSLNSSWTNATSLTLLHYVYLNTYFHRFPLYPSIESMGPTLCYRAIGISLGLETVWCVGPYLEPLHTRD